jgi:hypothetical protein
VTDPAKKKKKKKKNRGKEGCGVVLAKNGEQED